MNRLIEIYDASASVIWPQLKSYFDPEHQMFLSLEGSNHSPPRFVKSALRPPTPSQPRNRHWGGSISNCSEPSWMNLCDLSKWLYIHMYSTSTLLCKSIHNATTILYDTFIDLFHFIGFLNFQPCNRESYLPCYLKFAR